MLNIFLVVLAEELIQVRELKAMVVMVVEVMDKCLQEMVKQEQLIPVVVAAVEVEYQPQELLVE